jgi:hypothetical protein
MGVYRSETLNNDMSLLMMLAAGGGHKLSAVKRKSEPRRSRIEKIMTCPGLT